MLDYGQFCPVAKACEVLGERWTLLIMRELLGGATRYNELQRALGHISPTVLSKRLKTLEECGLLVRKRAPGERRHEYRLTSAGRELEPVVVGVGEWGMRWARGQMTAEELDVELLMVHVARTLRTEHLPDGCTVLKFHFPDLDEFADWWVVAEDGEADLCVDRPVAETDVRLTSDLCTLTEVFMGDLALADARRSGRLKLRGRPALLKNAADWLGRSMFAGIPAAGRD